MRRTTLFALTTVSAVTLGLAATPAAAQTEQAQAAADQPACGELATEAERATCVAAQAQTAPPPGDPQEEDTIVVTGTRIPRANFDTAQPAVVLGSEQIEARGYTNLGDALEELPAFGVPGNNPVGGQTGAFGAGQTFVNFFGLGDQRTLTVVNSRRFVSSNTASIFGPTGAGSQVDYNVIPTLIVDRVETIAVGGAPIYGADAIAGTVNIITMRKFNGIQLDAQGGMSEFGDAEEVRVGGLAGYNFLDDRANITAAVEYNKSYGLVGTDRPNAGLGRFFTTCAPGTSRFQQCLIEDRRIPALSPFGVPVVGEPFALGIPLSPGQAADFGFQPSVTDANGSPLGFDAAGNLIPIDFGERTGNLINFNGGGGFALPENLLTETRRYLGTLLVSFDVTDNIRLFGEGWYANSKGNQLRDQPVYNTGLFGPGGSPDGNLVLGLDNPFLSAEARAAIQASIASNPFSDQNIDCTLDDPDTPPDPCANIVPQDYFYLGRANTDIIPSDGSATVELYRFVGGLDGQFNAFGRDLRFEAVLNYGKSRTEGRERVLVQQNFENALNAVRDANGNIVCAPGFQNAPVRTISSTCVPINPFGQQIDPAAIDYVTTFAEPRATNSQLVATASVSGSLFEIWGGPVGFALGVERREEKADFNPGVFYFGQEDPNDPTAPREQFGRSIPIDPVRGKFVTKEVFGELTIPLIGPDQNIPLVRSIELNGAARYIDHSLAGGDLTWTAGATYNPIRDITFRGNYTKSVRSPAITELFNPTSQIFTTADDPCDSRFLNAGPNPANRQANCAADGLPDDFQSNIVDFTTRGTLQGNTSLENEKAKAWTIGAILRPRFLPGLTLAADYVNIKLRGAIETLDAQQTLEACYDAPSFPTPICDNFVRDANGQITFIQTGYANAARRDFAGVIGELAWRVPTPFLGATSTVNLGVNYIYYDTLETQVGLGDIDTLRGSIGYSKHQATTNLTYANKGFRAQLQAQYIGPARFDPDEGDGVREFPSVKHVTFFNGSLQYELTERFGVRFIVDNIFDTKPPFPAPGGGGRVTYFDGILGRYYKVGIKAKF